MDNDIKNNEDMIEASDTQKTDGFNESSKAKPAAKNDNTRDTIAFNNEPAPSWAVRLKTKRAEPTPILKNIFDNKSGTKGPLDKLKYSVENEPNVIDLDPDEKTVKDGDLVNCELFYYEDGIYYVYPETISSIEEWHHANCLRKWGNNIVQFRENGHPNAKLALEHKQKVLLYNSLLDLDFTKEQAIEYVKSINMDVFQALNEN